MTDILGLINRATELVDEGLRIYEQVKPVVTDAKEAISDQTLEEAQARLANSLQRAQSAHDGLKAAIQARLNK